MSPVSIRFCGSTYSKGESEISRSLLYPESLVLDDDNESRLDSSFDMLTWGKLVCLKRLETTESIARENYSQMDCLHLVAGKKQLQCRGR